MALILESKF